MVAGPVDFLDLRRLELNQAGEAPRLLPRSVSKPDVQHLPFLTLEVLIFQLDQAGAYFLLSLPVGISQVAAQADGPPLGHRAIQPVEQGMTVLGSDDVSLRVPSENQGQVNGRGVTNQHPVFVAVKFVSRRLAGPQPALAHPRVAFQRPFQQVQEVGRHKGPGPQLEGGEGITVGILIPVLANVGAVNFQKRLHLLGVVQHPRAVLVKGISCLGSYLDKLRRRPVIDLGNRQRAVLVAADNLNVSGHFVAGI